MFWLRIELDSLGKVAKNARWSTLILNKTVQLSPSDLTFLWDECKRCFYLKVMRDIKRPSAPFPAMFGKIDGLMKEFYRGKVNADLTPELPPGSVVDMGRWVESNLITIPGRRIRCKLRGIYDTLLAFNDGTYGVVDFKTSDPKESHVEFYGRQLRAYAYALEHPSPIMAPACRVSRLGLLIVSPDEMRVEEDGRIAYVGSVTWKEIPVDESGFLLFLEDVISVLEQDDPPAPAEKCAYCIYRANARQHGF